MAKDLNIERQNFQMLQAGFLSITKSLKVFGKQLGITLKDLPAKSYNTLTPEHQKHQMLAHGFASVAHALDQLQIPALQELRDTIESRTKELSATTGELLSKSTKALAKDLQALESLLNTQLQKLCIEQDSLDSELKATQKTIRAIAENTNSEINLLRKTKLSRSDFEGLKTELRGKKGEPGKDADEKKIVQEVLAKIPPPKLPPLEGDEVVEAINSLSKYGPKIDASHIANLPTPVIQRIIGGGGSSAAGNFIKLDGTSTTTAQIPFAEGLSLPSNKMIIFGGDTDNHLHSNAPGQMALMASSQLNLSSQIIFINGDAVKVGGGMSPNLDGGADLGTASLRFGELFLVDKVKIAGEVSAGLDHGIEILSDGSIDGVAIGKADGDHGMNFYWVDGVDSGTAHLDTFSYADPLYLDGSTLYLNANSNGDVVIGGAVTATGNIKFNGGTAVDQNGYLIPISSTDAAAPNNSVYYSTTASKLVFKDGAGVVNNLY